MHARTRCSWVPGLDVRLLALCVLRSAWLQTLCRPGGCAACMSTEVGMGIGLDGLRGLQLHGMWGQPHWSQLKSLELTRQ